MAWPFALILTLAAQQTAPADAPPTAPAASAPAEAKSAPTITVAPAPAAKPGAKPAPAAPAASESILPQIILFAPVILVFYLLAIRPQQQQEKKRKAMVSSISKGSKVLTVSGIYGTVVSHDANSDKVVIRIDDDKGVRMTVSKASIGRVLESVDEKPATAS